MSVHAIILIVTTLQVHILLAEEPSVLIIGAGVSGIAASSKLIENNITNFKILESQERIGGRIFTIQLGDATLDLGAEWCHGEINNIEYDLVKNYDLLARTNTSFVFLYSRPKNINKNDIQELHVIYDDIYSKRSKSYHVSLGNFIKTEYMKVVEEKYLNDPLKLKFAVEFLSSLDRKLLITTGAFSLNDTSEKSDYVRTEGNHTLNWKGRGQKTILDVLMKEYSHPEVKSQIVEKIYFNKKVINILWNSNDALQKVRVTCSDGSVYYADHVILTVSLGVLKYKNNSLFSPSLPINKLNAIENLGIGAVFKVFLYYSNKWWPQSEFENFNLIWNEEDKLQVIDEFPYGPMKDGQSWLVDLVGFSAVTKQPNVLMVWFVGELVPEMEKLSNEMIIDGTTYILNKFLRPYYQNIPKADYVFRNNWYSDPNFRGTYSFQTLNSRKGDMSDEMLLAEPLTSNYGKKTLFIAGEATSRIHYGTVHGAIESGFTAAETIINDL